jgi:hypothetical protein
MMFMHKSFNPFATLLMVVSVLLAYFCGFFFTYTFVGFSLLTTHLLTNRLLY